MGFVYKKPPCTKTCERRNATCHANCPDYIDWEKDLKEANAKARKKYEAEHDTVGYIISEVSKRRKRHYR